MLSGGWVPSNLEHFVETEVFSVQVLALPPLLVEVPSAYVQQIFNANFKTSLHQKTFSKKTVFKTNLSPKKHIQENGLQNKPFTKKHSPFYPPFLLHYAAGLC